MKRHFHFIIPIFILFLSISNWTRGQESLDSLIMSLKTMKVDTVKVNVYIAIANSLGKNRRKIEIAEKYTDTIRLLSEELNYDFGLANSHYIYAKLVAYKGDFEGAIVHLESYLEYHRKNENSLRIAMGLFEMGKAFKNLGAFPESLSHLFRAASIYERANELNDLALTYNSIGGIHSKTGKKDEAIAYYQKANAIFKQLGENKMFGMGMQNVGNVHARNAEYELAIKNYTKALQVIKALDLVYEKAIILGNLGGAYTGLNEHNTALQYYLRAYAIKKKLPNKRSLAYAMTGLGTSYMMVSQNLKALEKLDSALLLAKEIGTKDLIAQILELKADASMKRKRYQDAYQNIIESNIWRDSVFNEKSDSRISELKIQYETTQKDQEIALLTKENEVQLANAKEQKTFQSALIGGLVLLAIIAGLIFYSLRSRLKNQKLLAVKNEEIRMSQIKEQLGTLEMKALRAQMNPHFLFNCMNSINRMIMAEENDKASKYLSKFSKLVRLMLENSENPKVTLKDELQMLKSYIELESIRFKNKMDYKIVVDEAIDQESTFIPSMVLQPFVENAIWHGLLHKDSKGFLTIAIKEVGDNLHCTIIDNGVGREKSLKLRKQSGHKKVSMGIKITSDRLKLLTKQKINEAIQILDLKDDKNNAVGTQVDILIPVS